VCTHACHPRAVARRGEAARGAGRPRTCQMRATPHVDIMQRAMPMHEPLSDGRGSSESSTRLTKSAGTKRERDATQRRHDRNRDATRDAQGFREVAARCTGKTVGGLLSLSCRKGRQRRHRAAAHHRRQGRKRSLTRWQASIRPGTRTEGAYARRCANARRCARVDVRRCRPHMCSCH